MRRIVSLAPLRAALLVALLAACGAPDAQEGGGGIRRVEVGAEAPPYSTVSLDGDSVSLAEERGNVVLVNIWATWCHPCREEIPALQALHEQYESRGLRIVGVSVDTDGADNDIRAFMKEYGMTYSVWRDPGERIMARFLVLGVPSSYLIDRNGVLVWKKPGAFQPGDTTLTRVIESAIATD